MIAINRHNYERITGARSEMITCSQVHDDSFTRTADGSLDFDYTGDTEEYWDTQIDQIDSAGHRMFEDACSNLVSEADVILVRPCPVCGQCDQAKAPPDCETCGGLGLVLPDGQRLPPLPDTETGAGADVGADAGAGTDAEGK